MGRRIAVVAKAPEVGAAGIDAPQQDAIARPPPAPFDPGELIDKRNLGRALRLMLGMEGSMERTELRHALPRKQRAFVRVHQKADRRRLGDGVLLRRLDVRPADVWSLCNNNSMSSHDSASFCSSRVCSFS